MYREDNMNVQETFLNCLNNYDYKEYLYNLIYPDGYGSIYIYMIFKEKDTLYYVGQNRKLSDRKYSFRRRHQRHLKGDLFVDRLLRKYKYFICILDILPVSALDDAERRYIGLFDSFRNGLNFTEGGVACGSGDSHPLKGRTPSLDTINKIRKKSVENNNYVSGPMSDEVKKKIGMANGRKIHQYAVDGVFINQFNSASEASRMTGVPTSGISSCASGKRHNAGGFLWEWSEQPKRIKDRILLQIDLDGNIIGRFSGPLEAQKQTGISQSSICSTISGRQKTAGRCFWRYE